MSPGPVQAQGTPPDLLHKGGAVLQALVLEGLTGREPAGHVLVGPIVVLYVLPLLLLAERTRDLPHVVISFVVI